MHFVAESQDEVPAKVANACVVYVRAIEDQRGDASSFGPSPNFQVFALHVPDWVRDAIASLDRPGRKITLAKSADESAPTDALSVTVRIHKAYVEGMATSKSTQIVLSNQYESGGRVLGTSFYRGSDTSVNWANSPDEVEAGMNSAMNVALAAIGKDMDRYCASRETQASTATNPASAAAK